MIAFWADIKPIIRVNNFIMSLLESFIESFTRKAIIGIRANAGAVATPHFKAL
jgi:hypothetical protein